MMQSMERARLPSKAELGQIAENDPLLLNMLVAYFVFEWRSVTSSDNPHGIDQTGRVRRVPNFVMMWGIDECLHRLLQGPDGWAKEILDS